MIYIKQLSAFMLLLVLFSCNLDPCSSKDTFLTSLEEEIEETRKSADRWSDDQWKDKDADLKKLMDECYPRVRDEMSREERREVLSNSLKYIVLREKEKFDDLNDQISNIDWEKKVDELLVIADEEVKMIFDEAFRSDLENLIDGALGELENLTSELRKSWEEVKQN